MTRILRAILWWEITQAAISISIGAVYPWLIHFGILADRFHLFDGIRHV